MNRELPEGWAEVTPGSFTDGSARIDAKEDGTLSIGVEVAPDAWKMVPVPPTVLRAALRVGVARRPDLCCCSACFRGDPENCEQAAWIERLQDQGYLVEGPEDSENEPNTLREKLEAEGLLKYVEDPKLAYREGLAEGTRIRLDEHRVYRTRVLWILGVFFVAYLLFAVFSGVL